MQNINFIELTSYNGNKFLVNAEKIERVTGHVTGKIGQFAGEYTVLWVSEDDTYHVKEPYEEVKRMIMGVKTDEP